MRELEKRGREMEARVREMEEKVREAAASKRSMEDRAMEVEERGRELEKRSKEMEERRREAEERGRGAEAALASLQQQVEWRFAAEQERADGEGRERQRLLSISQQAAPLALESRGGGWLGELGRVTDIYRDCCA